MQKRPRVVFVSSVFEDVDTGPGVYARYLWEHLCNDPLIELHVVAPEFHAPNTRLVASGRAKSSYELYRRLQRYAWELAVQLGPGTIVHGNAAHSMSRFIDYAGPWLVQINDYELAELPCHWDQVLRRVGYRRLLALAWRRHHEGRVLRHADLALCNSDYTRQTVLRAYQVDEARLVTLRKAVEVSHFVPPADLPEDPLPQRPLGARLVFVGTDWQRKGLDVLLDSLPAVVARHPEVSLVVVGPMEQSVNSQIRNRAASLELASSVYFAGRLSQADIARVFWHSDVAVLPSRREALGVAALEAMAAGLPVVASRTGGIPEVVEDEVSGLLCVPGDSVDLAQKLNRVLESQELRNRLAAGGRKRVEEFSTERMVRELRDLYLGLAERWRKGEGRFRAGDPTRET